MQQHCDEFHYADSLGSYLFLLRMWRLLQTNTWTVATAITGVQEITKQFMKSSQQLCYVSGNTVSWCETQN